MSIMQCSIHNQYSVLFTCIIDYLHVLCMILMILSCVLCMTLMIFIYVYYRLFAYTNLVDVMSLFFTVFSFYLPNFSKNRPISDKNPPEIATPIFRKTGRISVFRVFTVTPLFLVSFGHFFQFLPNFNEFLKNRRDR
jgi:hypothetical protein